MCCCKPSTGTIAERQQRHQQRLEARRNRCGSKSIPLSTPPGPKLSRTTSIASIAKSLRLSHSHQVAAPTEGSQYPRELLEQQQQQEMGVSGKQMGGDGKGGKGNRNDQDGEDVGIVPPPTYGDAMSGK